MENRRKHLTYEERLIIEQGLGERDSFKGIGHKLGKDPTTVAKEVRKHIQVRKIVQRFHSAIFTD